MSRSLLLDTFTWLPNITDPVEKTAKRKQQTAHANNTQQTDNGKKQTEEKKLLSDNLLMIFSKNSLSSSQPTSQVSKTAHQTSSPNQLTKPTNIFSIVRANQKATLIDYYAHHLDFAILSNDYNAFLW